MKTRLNPPIYYQPEKGKPTERHSGWLDVSKVDPKRPLKRQRPEAGLSNTYWLAGVIDYSGATPEVWVENQLTKREFDRVTGSRYSSYLLHPDKWEALGNLGFTPPAWWFLPALSQGKPGRPLRYAYRIRWETSLHLVSEPGKGQNPRAWFAGRGAAFALAPGLGRARIHSTGKIVTVAEEIVVLRADAPHPGPEWTRIRGRS